jgi:DNA-binding NarL/FixJ family response regulator
VLLADDNHTLLDEVRALLEPKFDVVGEVGDGQALVEAAERLEPDVLVVDISMPIVSGIEAARRLRAGGGGPKIVFLTVHEDPALVETALSTGALGYVLKTSAVDDLLLAIDDALRGRRYVSPVLRAKTP